MKLFKNIFKYVALSTALMLLITSCDDDDFTGDSTVKPSSPTVSVTGGGSHSSNEAAETKYEFVVSLSEAQVADVIVYVSVTGGTAVADVNYKLSSSKVVIPALATSAGFNVQILSDPLPNETLTLEIQIGDERTNNVTITPVMSDFTIENFGDDDLALDLSWSTEPVFDASGSEIDATDVADMIFTMVDAGGITVDESDGGSFESLVLAGDATDGDYFLRASFYGVLDAGDLGGGYDVSLQLDYNQIGTQLGGFPYPTAMNIATNCVGADYVTMVKVTKVGTSYTIEDVNENTFSADVPETIIPGSYTELNDDGNPQTATVTMSAVDVDGKFTITNFAYSSGWWCGHPDATLDLVVVGLDVYFPGLEGEGETQLVGNLPNLCGVYGEATVTLDDLGSWNPCTGVITFGMTTRVAAGSFGHSDMTYTPN